MWRFVAGKIVECAVFEYRTRRDTVMGYHQIFTQYQILVMEEYPTEVDCDLTTVAYTVYLGEKK